MRRPARNRISPTTSHPLPGTRRLFPLRFAAGLLVCCLLLAVSGCRSPHTSPVPSIAFTRIPPSGHGPDYLGHIGGQVSEFPASKLPTGSRIVLYALGGGTWWVQPFEGNSGTTIAEDGRWENVTHLGTQYAAILVGADYQPKTKLTALPEISDKVLAVAVTNASSDPLPPPKMVHFSGYDWVVRSSPNSSGGTMCNYEPANAWVDEHGYLHLLMAQGEGVWHCAGIILPRSLGYGTYRFVVADTSSLPPSAVLTMYTKDEDGAEMDIELGRWGRPANRNADYVVQPYYIPENTVHFDIPAGPTSHELRWEPGRASFKSTIGASENSHAVVMEHVFKSGVPVPAKERLHLAFYDFQHSESGPQHPIEIVVQKFEYLP